MTYRLPAYQRRMMGYDQPGGLRSVASSYTHALLTVGTAVRMQRLPSAPCAQTGDGRIIAITELGTARGGWVRVLWPSGVRSWHHGEHLMRVGAAK